MQTHSIKWNYSSNKQEFFFAKLAPVESITDIILFDFWLILLSWMFILSYITIYFFVKKFSFFQIFQLIWYSDVGLFFQS